MSIIIRPRSTWGAIEPSSPLQNMPVPTPIVYVHHSASDAFGPSAIKSFQHYHMTVKGMRDIAYNFLIDIDSTIYEGRGWGKAHGGNTGTDNRISHSICLMGNFQKRILPIQVETSLVALLREGKARGSWLLTDVRGHQEEPGSATSCPGTNVMNRLSFIQARATALPPVSPPIEKEDDMMIIYDRADEPAILFVNGTVQFLTKDKRDFLRSLGVQAKTASAELYETLLTFPRIG